MGIIFIIASRQNKQPDRLLVVDVKKILEYSGDDEIADKIGNGSDAETDDKHIES